jgi:hypothetical protein
LEEDLQIARSPGPHEISLVDPVVRRPYLITADLQDFRDMGVNILREEKELLAMIAMDYFPKVKRHGNFLKS